MDAVELIRRMAKYDPVAKHFEHFRTEHGGGISSGTALAIKILTGANLSSVYVWRDGKMQVNTYPGEEDNILPFFPDAVVLPQTEFYQSTVVEIPALPA